jgi:hypothetical protein
MVLEAVSAEYHETRGDIRGSEEFESRRAQFQSWSYFQKFKFIIVFIVESKIGLIPIRSALAQAARNRALAYLARLGIREGVNVGASQIIRKISLFLELAWAAGCAGYCGSIAFVNATIDFTTSAMAAIADFTTVAGQLGRGISTQLIARPVLLAQATTNPSNWDTTAGLVTLLLGHSLWSQLLPDDPNLFLANIARPMSTFNISSDVIVEIATAMSRAVDARGGFQVTFTPDFILGLTQLTFVQLLRDRRLLRFRRDPEQIADETLRKTQPNQ